MSLSRSIWSYSKVQTLVSLLLRNNPLQLKLIEHLEYLNVGCGPNILDGFINLDWHWRPGINLCWDLRRRLPFGENRLGGIFIEHCLEHFPFDQVQWLLTTFYKCMKPGGALRLVVPDSELYISKYMEAKNKTVEWPYGQQDAEHTPLMLMSHIWLNYGHESVYDFDTLNVMLKKADFKNIRKESYNQGRHKTLLCDCEGRRIESMYVEAEK